MSIDAVKRWMLQPARHCDGGKLAMTIPPGARRVGPDAEAARLADERKRPAMDADVILAAIRESVTMVKPGETLIVRAQPEWTPNQIRMLQDVVDEDVERLDLGIKVLILPGEEFAVVAKGKP